MMKSILTVLIITFFLVISNQGQTEKLYFSRSLDTERLPERMIEDGLKKILNTLELFIRKMPNYEIPEILDNGDIIIRKVKPEHNNPPAKRENPHSKPDYGI